MRPLAPHPSKVFWLGKKIPFPVLTSNKNVLPANYFDYFFLFTLSSRRIEVIKEKFIVLNPALKILTTNSKIVHLTPINVY